MPKETKDLEIKETKKTVAKKPSTKTTKTAKATASKKVETKKDVADKTSTAKTTTKKAVSKTNTTTSSKRTATKKSATTSKKATTKKASTTKKTTTRKKAATKATKTKKELTEKTKFINEYYDLPYRYNQTIVKILAQTPKRLFVYWDISDEDRNNLQKSYGENFFERTKPVLVVHNNTLGYSFEVDINDFANSWYLPINDAKCEYTIELGRRPNPFYQNQSANNEISEIPQYIYISSSNNLEAPNNKVLYNPPIYKKIHFRNVKTNQIIEKDISDFRFIGNIESIGEFYDIYGLYAKFYKDEDLDYMNNPSSGNSSSMNFSSQFK